MKARRAYQLIGLSLIVAGLTGAPAAAAGGGPVIPGGAFGGEGATGPSGEPSAELRFVALPQGGRTMVAKIETDGGAVERWQSIDGRWALPAVTQLGDAAGISADGRTLVLIHPEYSFRASDTEFLILDAGRLKVRERLTLDGRFSFDAISPDGRLAYLVEYPDPSDPLAYSVRAYDLRSGEFRPGEVVDPSDPDEQMAGIPVARGYSADGRWAYTLYGGGEETFIHALDTTGVTAACIDLPQFDPARNIYNLDLEVDPTSGAITVLQRDKPAASVDPRTFEVAPAVEPADAEESAAGDSSMLAWILLGGGAGLLGLVAAVWLRRRHARRIYDEELERLLASEDEDRREQAREGEPVG